MRRFVIGDIHGCAKALRALIEAIAPDADDEIVFLGDYIDRGPNSRDVIHQVIELEQRCRVVALRGNHEIMLLGVVHRGLDDEAWLRSGGNTTITSYGGSLGKIPDTHMEFLRNLKRYHETEETIFVHAGYKHDRDMFSQDDMTMFWSHLSFPMPPPHQSGKRVIVGHTPQPSGEILDLGHLVCVDTYCFGGRFLTALNVDSGDVLQANYHGHLRRAPITVLVERLSRLRRWLSARWTGLSRELDGEPDSATGEPRSQESDAAASHALAESETVNPAIAVSANDRS